MNEITGFEAGTIHRLLNGSARHNLPGFNLGNPCRNRQINKAQFFRLVCLPILLVQSTILINLTNVLTARIHRYA
jgi:hypothetical protein